MAARLGNARLRTTVGDVGRTHARRDVAPAMQLLEIVVHVLMSRRAVVNADKRLELEILRIIPTAIWLLFERDQTIDEKRLCLSPASEVEEQIGGCVFSAGVFKRTRAGSDHRACRLQPG